jgi:hypothetical protein
MREYKFEIFADYFQIHLEDCQNDVWEDIDWTKEAVETLIVAGKKTIAMGTARNGIVPVTIEIRDDAPSNDFDEWDHVNECSLEIPSGCFRIWSLDTYPYMSVEPEWYRIRIYYGNLDSLSKDGLEGDDHYKIVLWQAPSAPPQILKRRIKFFYPT